MSRLHFVVSLLALAVVPSVCSSLASAQAGTAATVVLGQAVEKSATEFTIPVSCAEKRANQSCQVRGSTDFAFKGAGIVFAGSADNGPAIATLKKDKPYYYFKAYYTQLGGQSLRTSADSAVVTFTNNAAAFAPPAAPSTGDSNPIGATACSGVKGTSLKSGGTMAPGTSLESPNKKYRLTYQPDGNLVVYEVAKMTALWASGTSGKPQKTAMQADGNLVVYRADNVAVWSSKTPTNAGAIVTMQDDGNLVVYRKDSCTAAWASR